MAPGASAGSSRVGQRGRPLGRAAGGPWGSRGAPVPGPGLLLAPVSATGPPNPPGVRGPRAGAGLGTPAPAAPASAVRSALQRPPLTTSFLHPARWVRDPWAEREAPVGQAGASGSPGCVLGSGGHGGRPGQGLRQHRGLWARVHRLHDPPSVPHGGPALEIPRVGASAPSHPGGDHAGRGVGGGGEPHVVSRAPGLGVAWSSLVSPLRGWAGACPVACSGASFSDGASGVWPYIYFGLFASCFLDFISCRLNCSTFLLRGQQTTLFKDQFSQSPRCLSDELLCHFHC